MTSFLHAFRPPLNAITRPQAGLDEATRRLRSYEDLENEIDDAIVRAGHAGPSHGAAAATVLHRLGGGGGGGNGGTHRGDDERKSDTAEAPPLPLLSQPTDLLQLIRGLPTNPERRIKQCVHLAQRLLDAEVPPPPHTSR